MATEPAVVYRTTDPGILAAWDTEAARRDDLYREAVKFAGLVDDKHRNLVGVAHETFTGLTHQADWPVPTGWKVGARAHAHGIVPDKRLKAGQHAAAVLERLSPGNPRDVLYRTGVGLPTSFFGILDGGMRYIQPGVMRTNDALYTTWAVAPPGAVDTAKWHTVPLSAYYTAREQLIQERQQAATTGAVTDTVNA